VREIFTLRHITLRLKGAGVFLVCGTIRRKKIPRDVLMATYFLREAGRQIKRNVPAAENLWRSAL
jgi:hypothetical protein